MGTSLYKVIGVRYHLFRRSKYMKQHQKRDDGDRLREHKGDDHRGQNLGGCRRVTPQSADRGKTNGRDDNRRPHDGQKHDENDDKVFHCLSYHGSMLILNAGYNADPRPLRVTDQRYIRVLQFHQRCHLLLIKPHDPPGDRERHIVDNDLSAF